MTWRAGGVVGGVLRAGADAYSPIVPVLTIESVGDGSVSQFQQGVIITLSTSPDPITSVTIGGVSHIIASQEPGFDGARTVTLQRIEALGASGNKAVVVSDGTSTANGQVAYTRTHEYAAPAPGDYDTNSIFVGSEFPAGSYFRIVSGFSNVAFKSPYTGWADAPLANDVNDYLQAAQGFGGDIVLTLEMIANTGAIDQWVATISVDEPDIIPPSGYTASWDQASITPANETAASFTMAGAEVGTELVYIITSSGGPGSVTNADSPHTVATATDQLTGIDVSSLPDGILTLSVTLTDEAGNTGPAATNLVAKNVEAGLSVIIVGDNDQPRTNTSIDWFITLTWGGAVLDSGTTLTDDTGALVLDNLTAEPGPAWLFYRLTSDDNFAAAAPVVLL